MTVHTESYPEQNGQHNHDHHAHGHESHGPGCDCIEVHTADICLGGLCGHAEHRHEHADHERVHAHKEDHAGHEQDHNSGYHQHGRSHVRSDAHKKEAVGSAKHDHDHQSETNSHAATHSATEQRHHRTEYEHSLADQQASSQSGLEQHRQQELTTARVRVMDEAIHLSELHRVHEMTSHAAKTEDEPVRARREQPAIAVAGEAVPAEPDRLADTGSGVRRQESAHQVEVVLAETEAKNQPVLPVEIITTVLPIESTLNMNAEGDTRTTFIETEVPSANESDLATEPPYIEPLEAEISTDNLRAELEWPTALPDLMLETNSEPVLDGLVIQAPKNRNEEGLDILNTHRIDEQTSGVYEDIVVEDRQNKHPGAADNAFVTSQEAPEPVLETSEADNPTYAPGLDGLATEQLSADTEIRTAANRRIFETTGSEPLSDSHKQTATHEKIWEERSLNARLHRYANKPSDNVVQTFFNRLRLSAQYIIKLTNGLLNFERTIG